MSLSIHTVNQAGSRDTALGGSLLPLPWPSFPTLPRSELFKIYAHFTETAALKMPYVTGVTMLKTRKLLLWVKQVLSLQSTQLACSVRLYIAPFAHKGYMNSFWTSSGFQTSLQCFSLSPIPKGTVNYLKPGKDVLKLFPAPLKNKSVYAFPSLL